MARTLKRTVVAGGVTYAAGTEETAKLSKAIPNEKAWDGELDAAPAARKSTPAKKQQAAKPPGASGGSTSDAPPTEPPRGGEGSGEDVWRAYAEGLGIEVPEDAGRDDIIALVDARASE